MTGGLVLPVPLLELLKYGGYPIVCHAQTTEFHDNRLHLQCDAIRGSELVRQIERECGRTNVFE